MLILIFMFMLSGCSGCPQSINESVRQMQEQERMLIPEANEREEVSGEQLFTDKGCVACHEYNTELCPSLEGLSKRETFLGGKEKVSATNLARWLRDPAAMKPGTAMPNLGLSEEEINELVRYLLTK